VDGSAYNDTINGGSGDDTPNGNRGNDVLQGDQGADLFLLSKGYDLIADFSFREGCRIGIVSGQEFSFEQSGTDLLILREQGTTTLMNIALAAFEAANVIVVV
jgi:Ca2+-binding RTX toxin-like protein